MKFSYLPPMHLLALAQYHPSNLGKCLEQECIPVGCILPGLYFIGEGGFSDRPRLHGQLPARGQRPPCGQTLLDRDPNTPRQRSPGQRSKPQETPLDRDPLKWTETPLDMDSLGQEVPE